jgi:Arabinose efflux permease
MFELAIFRAFQGLGAGGLFSLALTIVADIVPPRERARYQGMFLAVFGTSSVAGPVIGGAFAGVDEFLFLDGWRWVFLMNLPIGAVSLFMVLRFLHIPHNPRPQKIDWWGAVTIVIAVVPFLLVAEQGREWGWSSPLSIAMYLLGTTGIISFILIERKMKDAALLPLKLFSEPTFARTQLMGFIIGIGMFGGMITLPLVLQVVYGASPTEAGLLMLPMVGGLMVSSIVSGQTHEQDWQVSNLFQPWHRDTFDWLPIPITCARCQHPSLGGFNRHGHDRSWAWAAIANHHGCLTEQRPRQRHWCRHQFHYLL